jgi:hypothetical protein
VPRYINPATTESLPSPSRSAGGIDPLPDKHDVARKYKVCVRTVDRWVKERKIPHLLLGKRSVRFRWVDVERAINRMTVEEVK